MTTNTAQVVGQTQVNASPANGTPSEVEQLRARIAELEAQISSRVKFMVSEKGAISAVGLGAYPTTLYVSQWEPLIQSIKAGVLDRFISENRSKLSFKTSK